MSILTTLLASSQLLWVFLFWKKYGASSLGRIGFYFLVMACLFHGVTEIIQFLLPDLNYYRTLSEDNISLVLWIVCASIGSGVFYYAYRYADTRLVARSARARHSNFNSHSISPVSFVIVVAAAITGIIVYVLNSTGMVTGYFAEGLLAQFLIVNVFVAGVIIIQLLKGRGYLAVLVGIMVFSFTIGQRSFLLAGFLCIVYSLFRFDYKIKRSVLIAMFLGMLMLMTLIVFIRQSLGREVFLGSISDRIVLIRTTSELVSERNEATRTWFEDIAYRIDGNTLPSLILRRMNTGHASIGLGPLGNNFLLAVPAFLYPEKALLDAEKIEERGRIQQYYDVDYGIDFLLPLYGQMLSYYGPLSLLIGCALFGIMYGCADYWLKRTSSVASTYFAISALFCVVLTEQGFRVYFTTFRGIILAMFMFMIFDLLKSESGNATRFNNA